jgi:hypothetical protein
MFITANKIILFNYFINIMTIIILIIFVEFSSNLKLIFYYFHSLIIKNFIHLSKQNFTIIIFAYPQI